MNHVHPKQFIYTEHYGDNHLHADERYLQHSFPLHWHDYYEIELCTSGEGIQRINGVAYPFSKGSFILLRPSDFHEVEVLQPLSYFNASFSSLAIDKKYLHALLKKNRCICGTLANLLLVLHDSSPVAASASKSVFFISSMFCHKGRKNILPCVSRFPFFAVILN